MARLHDHLPFQSQKREPPYKSILELTPEERQNLGEKLGRPENYNPVVLREMARRDRQFLSPLVYGILSAEFRGIDFFGRFVVECQKFNLPWHMTLTFARQTWDESRHTLLNLKVLEHLGGKLGDWPDIIVGPPPSADVIEELDPLLSLARINVGLEGFALTTFEEVRQLAGEQGDELMYHAHDYNMADEVTHVMFGDYWVEKLARNDPKEKERALKAQKEFENAFAMLRQMAVVALQAQSARAPGAPASPAPAS